MIDIILHVILLAVVIYFIAESLPSIYIDGFGTAIAVSIIYSLINVTLGTILKLISLPFIIITIGLFLLVINTFLLWLTDQLLDDFEIEDMGTTLFTALVITLSDTLLGWIF